MKCTFKTDVSIDKHRFAHVKIFESRKSFFVSIRPFNDPCYGYIVEVSKKDAHSLAYAIFVAINDVKQYL